MLTFCYSKGRFTAHTPSGHAHRAPLPSLLKEGDIHSTSPHSSPPRVARFADARHRSPRRRRTKQTYVGIAHRRACHERVRGSLRFLFHPPTRPYHFCSLHDPSYPGWVQIRDIGQASNTSTSVTIEGRLASALPIGRRGGSGGRVYSRACVRPEIPLPSGKDRKSLRLIGWFEPIHES